MRLLASSPVGFEFYFSDRSDGDARSPLTMVNAYFRHLDRPLDVVIARVSQTHSASVLVVPAEPFDRDCAGSYVTLGQGDAIVSVRDDLAAAILVADCAPVALFDTRRGINAVVHCGWRGTALGIISKTISVMRNLGASDITAVVGPHAGPCCYEFSPVDILELNETLGVSVGATTRANTESLDILLALGSQFDHLGVTLGSSRPPCTICDAGFYSYRNGDTLARQALIMVPVR